MRRESRDTGVRAKRLQPGRKGARSRGSTLVPVMAIIAAVLLVGVAIFILGHSEGDIVENAVDDSRAFYIAEGGLERARGYLTALELDDPNATPTFGTLFDGEELGGGSYRVELTDASGGGWLDAYEVVSTGEKDGALRQVKATLVAETFAIYQFFIGSVGGGYSWFRTGERFEGPVHVNGNLGIDGDPWFGGIVRIGGNHIQYNPPSDPTFVRGYEFEVEQIPLPSRDEVLGTLRVVAAAGGFIPAESGPTKAYWEVELNGLTFDAQLFDKDGNPISSLYDDVLFSDYNGVLWFDDDVRIKGTLDGQVTIGVDGDVRIMGDILYADSTPGSGPNSDCDDVLGIVATGSDQGNIIIDYNLDNADDCEVHGVLMALKTTIEAEDYMHHDPRGRFIIYGGLIAKDAVHLAQMSDGVVISGYIRDYHYESRLITLPPPFFPFASDFAVVTWEEVVPVVMPS